MLSFESPHRGDSNEYKQYTSFNIKMKSTLNCPKSTSIVFFKGLKNEFETAMVNEPSGFELLKFYCISPVLRIDNQQNFKIMKILILLKSFISLSYIIRYILRSMM